MGYYSIVAKARLLAAQPVLSQRKMASTTDKKTKAAPLVQPVTLTTESIISATIPQPQATLNASDTVTVETDDEIVADSKNDTDSVADDSDEAATDAEAEEKNSEEKTAEVAPESAPEESTTEDLFSNLKDPRLQAIFQRADILRQLGFNDWSNKELQYIEARTRNKTYLQNLMEKYEVGNDYSRSAYLAEVYYENERRKSFSASNPAWKKAFPEAFEKMINKTSDNLAVPQALLWGIMRTESFFKPYAHSGVGALGLMQVMPLTAQKMAEQLSMSDFKTSQLFDPETNIKIGGKYIQRLSKMFDNNVPLIAAGYNAGPHRVYSWLRNFGSLSMDEFIEHIPYSQTRGYAKKVLRGYYVYNSLYFPDEMKKKTVMWLAEPPKVSYSGPIPTRESWDPF
jgi:soluble lytic murein transglycosylase